MTAYRPGPSCKRAIQTSEASVELTGLPDVPGGTWRPTETADAVDRDDHSGAITSEMAMDVGVRLGGPGQNRGEVAATQRIKPDRQPLILNAVCRGPSGFDPAGEATACAEVDNATHSLTPQTLEVSVRTGRGTEPGRWPRSRCEGRHQRHEKREEQKWASDSC